MSLDVAKYLTAIPELVAIHDLDGTYLWVSESYKHLGYEQSDLVGRNAYEFIHPADSARAAAHHQTHMETETPHGVRIRFKMKSRQWAWLEAITTMYSEGDDHKLVTSARIINDVIYAEERLWRMAQIDPMTGLFRRHVFDERLVQAIAEAKRGRPMALIYADLDKFSEHNATYGHEAANKTLAAFGDLLLEQVREVDVVSRVGGEEFAILCPGTTAIDATILAERIRKATKQMEGGAGPVTVSLGVAGYSDALNTPQAIMVAADQCLYRAKQSGRDRAVMYRGRPFSQSSAGRLEEK